LLLLLLLLMMMVLRLLLLLLLWHVLRGVFRRVKVLLEVWNDSHAHMLLEKPNSRVISSSASLCPGIDLDGTVITKDVGLLTSNREYESHSSRMMP
jgi:hypothetical protein